MEVELSAMAWPHLNMGAVTRPRPPITAKRNSSAKWRMDFNYAKAEVGTLSQMMKILLVRSRSLSVRIKAKMTRISTFVLHLLVKII